MEENIGKRQDLLENSKYEAQYKILKNILSKNSFDNQGLEDSVQELKLANLDQLLYQRSCLAIGGSEERCIDMDFSKSIALRLIGSQFLPSFAILFGIGLIIRQCWRWFRKINTPWPDLIPIPLSMIDMVLLIAGGFVLLGEVGSPLFSLSFIEIVSPGPSTPIKESLKVFFGYIGMTIPPLLIFRRQINHSSDQIKPNGGWVQWKFHPI